jgi:Maltokinase N-terminal cap domain
MATIQPGATLTPGFREFLPQWVSERPWYRGGPPALRPAGFFRFEDPDGEVGMETHLLTDGAVVYQVPLTYRGAPLPGAAAQRALVTTAEHSVLGARWIYDAEADLVWIGQLLRLVQAGGVCDPDPNRGQARARGVPLGSGELSAATVTIELNRVQPAPEPAREPGVIGLVTGSWYPDGPDGAEASGCLAVIRTR